MPIFTTPTPIDLAIKLPVGALDIVASDRTDTLVTVTPTNPSKAVDRRGAEETKVDFDGQRLTITGPRPRSSPRNADPRSARCAPATTSRAGRAKSPVTHSGVQPATSINRIH